MAGKKLHKVIGLQYEIASDGELISWSAASDTELAPGSNSYGGSTSKELANFIERLKSVPNVTVTILSHHLKQLVQYLKNKLDKFKIQCEDKAYSFGTKVVLRDIGFMTNDAKLNTATPEEMLEGFDEVSAMFPEGKLPYSINAQVREDFCNDLLVVKPDDPEEIAREKRAYRANIWAANLDAPRLRLLDNSTRGGLDLVNPDFLDLTLTDVYGYDATSYYPYLLETQEFPTGAGRWVDCRNQKEVEASLNDFACLLEIEFQDIEGTGKYTYIDNPTYSENLLWDSYDDEGNRIAGSYVLSAKKLRLVIWSKELELIKKLYRYTHLTYIQCLQFDLSMLPVCFRKKLIGYYRVKTEKKGTKEEAQAKITLNAMAGTYQMRPIRVKEFAKKLGRIIYSETLDAFTDEEINAELEGDYNNVRSTDDSRPLKRFWSYVQGKYLTMLGRVSLMEHILANKEDFIMSATDAAYFVKSKEDYFRKADSNTYLFKIIPTINQTGKGRLSVNDFLPEKNGKTKMLGGWTEDLIEKIKILGPKRYLKQVKGEEPKLVHSGILTEESMELLKSKGDIWENYTDDFKGVTAPQWEYHDEPLDTREDAYATPKRFTQIQSMLRKNLGLAMPVGSS